jgi:LacI family transcriptional regulator
MPTLRDIGNQLGLSPATVSRALNGFPEVGEATRQRVIEVAERLNYQPNQIARKLVTGRSDLVGLVVHKPRTLSTDTTFFNVVGGISSELARHGVDLVLHAAVDDDPLAAYRRLVGKGTLDGFILNAPVPDDPRISFLKENGIPFVVHGTAGPGADYPFFDIDNAEASRIAVGLLCDLGHMRIALINGPEHHAFARDRRAGYDDAMLSRGRAVTADIVASGPMTESAGYVAALRMLNGTIERPTAFVCASTLVARGVYRAVADRGLSIPGDVSIISHDDDVPDAPADAFAPPLTTTSAPLTDACAPLAELLIAAIAGVTELLQRTAQPSLVIRRSTGPLR